MGLDRAEHDRRHGAWCGKSTTPRVYALPSATETAMGRAGTLPPHLAPFAAFFAVSPPSPAQRTGMWASWQG
jgi:hypothetical protein